MKTSLIALLISLVVPTLAQADLVAYWPLNESQGTTAVEMVGGHDGTLHGGPQWMQGKVGGALRFDGMDDYVSHTFDLPRTTGTLMHWVKTDMGRKGIIYYESDFPTHPNDYDGFGSGGPVLEIHSYWDNKFGLYYTDGDRLSVSDSDNINPGDWNHVAITWNMSPEEGVGELVIYINCEEQDRDIYTDITFANNQTLERFIGRPSDADSGRYFEGLVDEIKVYDEVLTANDIIESCAQSERDFGIGKHSTIATYSSPARDDEVVQHFCLEISSNGRKENVTDVILLVNAPFGDGFSDDMDRYFGSSYGACWQIPWVAASASGPNEVSRGWSNALVNPYPDSRLGSAWMQALVGDGHGNLGDTPGVIHSGSLTNDVWADLFTARANDMSGPNGYMQETPQIYGGYSGSAIQWKSEQVRHQAILFGGRYGNPNNLYNLRDALETLWQGEDYNIDLIEGGTLEGLFSAISQAASQLDRPTKLLLYLEGQGGRSVDLGEILSGLQGIPVPDGTRFEFEVPDSWITGTWGNLFVQPGTPVTLQVTLGIDDCVGCSSWGFYLNGKQLAFPDFDITGQVDLEFSPEDFRSGMNYFEIGSQPPQGVQNAAAPAPKADDVYMTLSSLQLAISPVSELPVEHFLAPGQSGSFYDSQRDGEGIFFEILENQKAVLYFFGYNADGTDQAWMLGLGDLVGDGLIATRMYRPVGASFGPGFDPNDVNKKDFGLLAFQLPDCASQLHPGSLVMTPNETGYEPMQDFNYTQLTRMADCAAGQGSAHKGYSGSWFNSLRDGEGIILQILSDDRVVVQWFTYDYLGEQMWVQGVGEISGDTLSVSNLYTKDGARWGSGFDPAEAVQYDWGEMTMTFDGCDSATLQYASTAGFGSGTLELQRLTSLMGLGCQP